MRLRRPLTRLLALARRRGRALALPAAAPAQIAPPYKLALVPGELVASPTTGGSTLAVKVQRNGTTSKLEFTPAAATVPSGCDNATTPGVSTCDETLVTLTELRFEGGVLSIEVDGVSTPVLSFFGGAERDTIDVDGPVGLEPGQVGTLELDPGPGNDSVTVSGRVDAITQTGSDPGDDRYVIDTDAPGAGTLQLGLGNDVATSSAPNLTLDGGTGADTLSGAGPLLGREGSDVLKPSVLGMIADGEGPATVAGPTDVDRLSFELMPAAVTLTKTSATDVQVASDGEIKKGIELHRGQQGQRHDRRQPRPGQPVRRRGRRHDRGPRRRRHPRRRPRPEHRQLREHRRARRPRFRARRGHGGRHRHAAQLPRRDHRRRQRPRHRQLGRRGDRARAPASDVANAGRRQRLARRRARQRPAARRPRQRRDRAAAPTATPPPTTSARRASRSTSRCRRPAATAPRARATR